jgi:hypothetical protein
LAGEIGTALGLPTNLLAHHVNVLEEAGVIERSARRETRRRTYLRLRPHTVAALLPDPVDAAVRVVFVCTHNPARSQLAAAVWARRSPVPTASAGTEPAPRIRPRALAVGRRYGLALGCAGTAHVRDVLCPDDLIVAVCDNATNTCPPTRTGGCTGRCPTAHRPTPTTLSRPRTPTSPNASTASPPGLTPRSAP